MNTGTEQHRITFHMQWIRPTLCIHDTSIWQGPESLRKTEGRGSSLETLWYYASLFKFKSLICLSTINFYFFSKKTGKIPVPRTGTWNKTSSKRNNNKTLSKCLCNCVASVLTETAVRNIFWQQLSPDKNNSFKATVLEFQHQISAQATPLMSCQPWFTDELLTCVLKASWTEF